MLVELPHTLKLVSVQIMTYTLLQIPKRKILIGEYKEAYCTDARFFCRMKRK